MPSLLVDKKLLVLKIGGSWYVTGLPSSVNLDEIAFRFLLVLLFHKSKDSKF